MRCLHDDTLSSHQFRRDKDCIAWFKRTPRLGTSCKKYCIRQRKILYLPMETLSKEQWQAYRSATHCLREMLRARSIAICIKYYKVRQLISEQTLFNVNIRCGKKFVAFFPLDGIKKRHELFRAYTRA